MACRKILSANMPLVGAGEFPWGHSAAREYQEQAVGYGSNAAS